MFIDHDAKQPVAQFGRAEFNVDLSESVLVRPSELRPESIGAGAINIAPLTG